MSTDRCTRSRRMAEVSEAVWHIPWRFHTGCTSKFVPIDSELVLRSNWNTMEGSVMFPSSFIQLTQTSPSTTKLEIVSPGKSIEWEETRRSTRFDCISVRRSRSDCRHGDYHLVMPVSHAGKVRSVHLHLNERPCDKRRQAYSASVWVVAFSEHDWCWFFKSDISLLNNAIKPRKTNALVNKSKPSG